MRFASLSGVLCQHLEKFLANASPFCRWRNRHPTNVDTRPAIDRECRDGADRFSVTEREPNFRRLKTLTDHIGRRRRVRATARRVLLSKRFKCLKQQPRDRLFVAWPG